MPILKTFKNANPALNFKLTRYQLKIAVIALGIVVVLGCLIEVIMFSTNLTSSHFYTDISRRAVTTIPSITICPQVWTDSRKLQKLQNIADPPRFIASYYPEISQYDLTLLSKLITKSNTHQFELYQMELIRHFGHSLANVSFAIALDVDDYVIRDDGVFNCKQVLRNSGVCYQINHKASVVSAITGVKMKLSIILDMIRHKNLNFIDNIYVANSFNPVSLTAGQSAIIHLQETTNLRRLSKSRARCQNELSESEVANSILYCLSKKCFETCGCYIFVPFYSTNNISLLCSLYSRNHCYFKMGMLKIKEAISNCTIKFDPSCKTDLYQISLTSLEQKWRHFQTSYYTLEFMWDSRFGQTMFQEVDHGNYYGSLVLLPVLLMCLLLLLVLLRAVDSRRVDPLVEAASENRNEIPKTCVDDKCAIKGYQVF